MTYDERREIEEYLDIVKKNANRLLHSVEMMQDAIGEMHCVIKSEEESENAKENFLKNY